MSIQRPWAFWRRAQYIAVFCIVVFILGGLSYVTTRTPGTCFDGLQNGAEAGVDCGGSCARICSFQVAEPQVQWARSFEIAEGRYNAVAYIENSNQYAGTPELAYTFKLYDADGVIVERKGITVLPPNSVYPVFEGRIQTGLRIPTQTVIELEPVSVWLSADAGREQFQISNRTLSGVGTMPRLTANITNNGVSAADSIEVIATIFDSKGNALTASETVVPSLPARGSQTLTFTWPNPIAGTLRSCEVPTDVVLAIDLSGSMNDDGGTPPQPISSVLNAAQQFTGRLNDADQVGVVTYATTAAVAQELTSSKQTAQTVIGGLTITPEAERGSTNTGDALIQARGVFASSLHNPDARMVTVLLTDGLATAPAENPDAYAADAAAALKADGVTLFTIGLGDAVNESFLTELSSGEGNYFKAASASTIDQIYRSVTSAICEDGPAVIDIIPKARTTFNE